MSCNVGFINVNLDGDCDDLKSYFLLLFLFSIVAFICALVTIGVRLKTPELKFCQRFSIFLTLVLGGMSINYSVAVLNYDTDPIIGWAVIFLVLGIVSVVIAVVSFLDIFDLVVPCFEKLLAYRRVQLKGGTRYRAARFDIA